MLIDGLDKTLQNVPYGFPFLLQDSTLNYCVQTIIVQNDDRYKSLVENYFS